MGKFSGFPLTRWKGEREMELIEEFIFTDKKQKEWCVPVGAILNGATIPKSLWSVIGSPYVGCYRRASVVHDYFVGEGDNPDVSFKDRRLADKMFFQASRAGGCSWNQAAMLYIGVSVGSWNSKSKTKSRGGLESLSSADEDALIVEKFDTVKEKCQGSIDDENFDALEMLVNQEIDS